MNDSNRGILNLWGYLSLGRTGRGTHSIFPSTTVFRTPSGLRVVPDFELDQTTPDASATEVGTIYALRQVRNYGLLAPAITKIDIRVFTEAFPGHTLTPTEIADIESQYAAVLEQTESRTLQEFGKLIASGVNPTTSISVPWLVHDILIGALSIALVVHAARSCIAARINDRFQRRLRRGHCPTCTYDITGLHATSATACPECGTPIPPVDAKLPIG
jgi:hypothetical protein